MILFAAILFFYQSTEPRDTLTESGRMVGLATTPSERLNPPHLIAPGQPPVLTFRTFDATDRGRFGALGLMTDDAGH